MRLWTSCGQPWTRRREGLSARETGNPRCSGWTSSSCSTNLPEVDPAPSARREGKRPSGAPGCPNDVAGGGDGGPFGPKIYRSGDVVEPSPPGWPSRSGAVCLPPVPDGADFRGVLVLVDAVSQSVSAETSAAYMGSIRRRRTPTATATFVGMLGHVRGHYGIRRPWHRASGHDETRRPCLHYVFTSRARNSEEYLRRHRLAGRTCGAAGSGRLAGTGHAPGFGRTGHEPCGMTSSGGARVQRHIERRALGRYQAVGVVGEPAMRRRRLAQGWSAGAATIGHVT